MKEKIQKQQKWAHAFKTYASSYNVGHSNSLNSELQLRDTKYAVKTKLKKLLSNLRGFKFVTLVAVLKNMESEEKTKYDTFCSHSNAETIINEGDIDHVFQSI